MRSGQARLEEPDEMNIERFRETLIRDEGLDLKRHKVKGVWHIGYGFNLEIEWDQELLDYLEVDDEDEIWEITQEQADWILDWHIESMRQTVSKRFPVFKTLSALRQEIIFNMRFNLGAGGLRGFKMMWEAIKEGDWKEAAVQMLDSKAAREDAPDRYQRLAAAFEFDNELHLELRTVYDPEKRDRIGSSEINVDSGELPVVTSLAKYTNAELIAELSRRLEIQNDA